MGVLKPRAGVNESLDVALSPQAMTWALHSGVKIKENSGKPHITIVNLGIMQEIKIKIEIILGNQK